MRKRQYMRDLRDIKSIHSSGARSIPKIHRSAYLELYIMRKEKDRWEKEIFALDKRRMAAYKKLNEIKKRMEKLEKEKDEELKIKTFPSEPGRPLKRMAINY